MPSNHCKICNPEQINHTRRKFISDRPELANTIFCWATIANTKNKTIYLDLDRTLSYCSNEGKKYKFVAFDYKKAIIVCPKPNREASTIVNTFQFICNMIEKKHQKKQFSTIFIVPQKDHRVKTVEGAIQNFKSHFISGLSSTDLMTHSNQHIKSSMENKTSIPNNGHHLVTKQLYTNIHNSVHHGAQKILMH
ncbi:hypothetical protein ACHAXS_000506, partial [Conticribra weissflogii]